MLHFCHTCLMHKCKRISGARRARGEGCFVFYPPSGTFSPFRKFLKLRRLSFDITFFLKYWKIFCWFFLWNWGLCFSPHIWNLCDADPLALSYLPPSWALGPRARLFWAFSIHKTQHFRHISLVARIFTSILSCTHLYHQIECFKQFFVIENDSAQQDFIATNSRIRHLKYISRRAKHLRNNTPF